MHFGIEKYKVLHFKKRPVLTLLSKSGVIFPFQKKTEAESPMRISTQEQ